MEACSVPDLVLREISNGGARVVQEARATQKSDQRDDLVWVMFNRRENNRPWLDRQIVSEHQPWAIGAFEPEGQTSEAVPPPASDDSSSPRRVFYAFRSSDYGDDMGSRRLVVAIGRK
ncbi:hypothetical protein V6N11_077345 [Hibiscus sabdariffa]|uniref:Uncharacterized protein n=1 Tax=Hibiscus sabdariffa TaxID=183260 RepID=A0ABR2TDP9_9ROSI